MSRHQPPSDGDDLYDQVGVIADRLVPEHGAAAVAIAFLGVTLAVALDLPSDARARFADLLLLAALENAPPLSGGPAAGHA